MDVTNRTLEHIISENMKTAASWASHADEWKMSLDVYRGILSEIYAAHFRERMAMSAIMTALRNYFEIEKKRNDNVASRDVFHECRNCLSEKLYVFSRVMGEKGFDHAKDDFEFRNGTLMFKHTDKDYHGEVRTMTLNELLEYINADRSDKWTLYTEDDWEEGMKEWTDLEIVKW